jgi:hypothetical protein
MSKSFRFPLLEHETINLADRVTNRIQQSQPRVPSATCIISGGVATRSGGWGVYFFSLVPLGTPSKGWFPLGGDAPRPETTVEGVSTGVRPPPEVHMKQGSNWKPACYAGETGV